MATINTEEFVGLSKKEAQNKAEYWNLIFRIVSVDDKPVLGLPEDQRTDRLCVELKKNKIVKAFLM